MIKRIYNSKYDWTSDAIEASKRIGNIIAPIFDEHLKNNWDINDLTLIFHEEIDLLKLKKVREIKCQKID